MKRIAFVVVFGLNLGATLLFAGSGQDAEMAAQKVGSSASAPAGSADRIPFTGAFAYSYPIEVPPGIAGVQPNIALIYNSGNGNGWLGQGWDLSLGAIQRSTKSGVPSYTDADVFTYIGGGTAIELVSADGGNVNYRPRIEGSFQRYVRENGGWTVYDKSGMKLSFGASAASRSGPAASQTFQWALDKVTDRNGNWYAVTYQSNGGQLYPDTVLYTGHDSTGKTHRRVHFTTAARPDPSFTMRPGFRVDANLRLASIETSVNPSGAAPGPWTPVRTYALGYGMRSMGVRSELATVQVTGTDGASTITLPPHRFSYQAALPGGSFWSAPAAVNAGYQLPNYITYNPRDNGLRFAELNGDGKIDLVRFYQLNGTPQVDTWLNTGSGWATTSSWHLPVPITVEGNGTWWDDGVRLVDLNGDGLTDVLRGLNYHEVTPTMEAWINTGTDFVSSPTWKIPDAKYCFTVTGVTQGVEWFRDNGVQLVDVNGDGLPDLVQSLLIDGTGTARSVRLNTGRGWAASDAGNWTVPPYLTLVAHDGRSATPNGVDFVDLNGDGLIDIVQGIRELSTLTDEKHRWLNTGSGWVETPAWGPDDFLMYRDSVKPFDNGIRFADMNGDGLVDLVQSLWQTTPVSINSRIVRFNNGTGWNPPVNAGFPEVFAQNDLNARNGLNTGTALLDLNGDGRPDMVRAYAQPGGVAKSLSFGTVNLDLLNRATSPAGGTADAVYGVASAEGTHQVPFPVTYLKSLTLGDGRGGTVTENYSYQGGLFDPAEREFLGFARVDGTDAAGTTTSSYFHQVASDAGGRMGGNPLKGRAYREEVSNGSLLRRVDTEWEAPILPPAARFARIRSVTETLYDGPAPQSSKKRYAYDDAASPRWGNALQTMDDGDPSVSGDERTEDVEFAGPAFPKRQRLLGPNGATVTETQLLYDNLPYGQVSKGNVTTTRRWLDKPAPGRWIESYAVYNASGQVTRATDARGGSASITYDPAGFPVSSTNPKGQTTSATFDLRSGAQLTATDANGLVQTSVFDALGRLTKEIGPDDSSALPTAAYLYHDELLGQAGAHYVETQTRERSGQSAALWSKDFMDGLGRTYRTEREAVGDSIITDSQFDGRGLLSMVALPRKKSSGTAPLWVSTSYDALRRPVRVTQPDGTSTLTTFRGRHTDVQDALGRVHGSDTDALGRIVRRTEPSISGATTLAYDAAGRLTSVVNALGQTMSMSYDSLGRKLSMNDPSAGAWSYAYDDNGNLVSHTDARGVKISFAYDALDRLKSRTLAADPGGVTGVAVGTILASLTYDETTGRPFSIGELTSVTGPAETISYYHDRMGRTNRELHTIDGMNYDVRTAFDAADRPISLTYPSDGRLSYSYNAAGLPDTIVNESSATLAQYAGYDALDRPAQASFGGGKTQSSWTYDPTTQLLARARTVSYATGAAVPFRDVAYGYDAARNVTAITDNLTAARSQAFAYDPLNRLTSAQGAYGTESYAYDDVGNLTSKGGRPYVYGDAAHPGAVTKLGAGARPGVDEDTLIGWGLDSGDPIYTISGTVRTASGGTATQAVVALNGVLSTAVSVSTATGAFTFRGVPAGAWTVTAYAAGQKSPPMSYAALGGNVSGLTLTLAASTVTAPTAVAPVTVGPSVVAGRLNGALAFNGTSDAFAFPDTVELGPDEFTVMIWVKPTAYPAAGTYATLISKAAPLDHHELTDGWRIVLTEDGRAAFEMARGIYTDFWTAFQIPLNQWSLLSFHYDGDKARFVYNGTYLSNRSFPGGIADSDYPVMLGASLDETGRPVPGTFFRGALDEPRFEGRAWDPDEIAALYAGFDVPGTAFAYDAAGNCVQKTASDATWAYFYDADGRLRRVDRNGATAATFVYGPTGARLKKITPAGTTLYIGDLYEQRPDGSRIDHIAGVGDVVRQGTGLSAFYAHGDHLGSVQQVTGAGGAVVQDAGYKPFGERFQSTGASPNRRWYTGQEEDAETGLDYYKARYYDPDLGRFTTPDSEVGSLLRPQSLNRYAYVEGAPTSLTDPSGHFLAAALVGAGAAMGAWVGYRASEAHGYNWLDWQTYAYINAGGAIGGASTAAGVHVAAAGIPLANTLGIAVTSTLLSAGLNALTGQDISPTIAWGFGSIDTRNGDYNSLFDGSNKWYEDAGYTAGALANLQDLVAGLHGISVTLNTERASSAETWSHSSLTFFDKRSISVGPEGGHSRMELIKGVPGKSWHDYRGESVALKLPIHNVNSRLIQMMSNNIANGRFLLGAPNLRYSLFGNSCVENVARALTVVGIPTLPINVHPYILYGQMVLRQAGIYAAGLTSYRP